MTTEDIANPPAGNADTNYSDEDVSRGRGNWVTSNRRRLLGAIGMGAVAATAGCLSGAIGGDASDGQADIDPTFGYAGTGEDDIPDSLSSDHTVGLHVDEEKFIIRNERPAGVEFGAFHFHAAGLHIDPGDVVTFELESPDHTITSLHPGLGRQQRVPDDVSWFSSPILPEGGFWLYKFEEPGVYDMVCAPHEFFGMALRIVVGDETGPVVRSEGRPPDGLTAALIGTGIPGDGGTPDLGVESLSPENIVNEGSVLAEDLSLDLALPIPTPTAPAEI